MAGLRDEGRGIRPRSNARPRAKKARPTTTCLVIGLYVSSAGFPAHVLARIEGGRTCVAHAKSRARRALILVTISTIFGAGGPGIKLDSGAGIGPEFTEPNLPPAARSSLARLSAPTDPSEASDTRPPSPPPRLQCIVGEPDGRSAHGLIGRGDNVRKGERRGTRLDGAASRPLIG